MDEIRRLFGKLRGVLRRRGRTRDEADELIQEAFLRLQVYSRGHQVQQAEAFLVRTALNLSVDRHRRAHADRMVANALETLPLADPGPSPDEVCNTQQRLQHLRAGLDSLSPRAREVFLMHRLDGYSHAQIAAQLGITLSMVEKHMARAALFITDWMDGIEE